MRKTARFFAERMLPVRMFVTLQSIRSRNFQRRLIQRTGHADAISRFVSQHGCEVRYGPFVGMRYPTQSILCRNGVPLLLGNYELELHHIIEKWQAEDYDMVIDVGCAEGYYAVGLARRLKLHVHAFDTEFRERNYCRQMAVENHVSDLINLCSWCSPAHLCRLAFGRRALVICDCEGFEVDLFNAEAINGLKLSDLLIELHTVSDCDATDTLCRRLAASHKIVRISYTGLGPERPELDCLGPERPRFVREMRS